MTVLANRRILSLLPARSTLYLLLLAQLTILSVPHTRSDQFDPPSIANEFKGRIIGKVNWVHKSHTWFMIWVKELQPEDGEPSLFEPLKNLPQGLKVAIAWNHSTPDAEMVKYLQSLRPQQPVTLDVVPGYQGGVRLAKVPSHPIDIAPAPVAESPLVPPLGASINETVIRHTIFVDGAASSGGDGSVARPFRTISEAMTAARTKLALGEPTKIKIAPGTYRETLGHIKLTGREIDTLLTIEGASNGTTIWSGAEVVAPSSWTDLGDGLYCMPWDKQWGFWSYVWETNNVLGQRSEMVFVDGRMQRQVLLEDYDYVRDGAYHDFSAKKGDRIFKKTYDPKTVLTPGTFGVMERADSGEMANKLYLRLSNGNTPSNVTIEVAVHRQAFRMDAGEWGKPGKRNLVLRDLTFTQFASRTKDRESENVVAISHGSSNILVERCRFMWNNASGLFIAWQETTVRDCVMNYNGFSGILGGASNALLINNTTNFNNWRGAWGGQYGWWIAGVKMHNSDYQHVLGHTALGNLAHGLWYDIHCRHILVRDLVAVENHGTGLFFELTNGPNEATRLLSANNGKAALRVSGCGGTRVTDSILYGNSDATVTVKTEGDSKQALIEYNWYLRSDEHANQQERKPGLFSLEKCVLELGPKASVLFEEHNGITRSDYRYPMLRYHGTDNIVFSQNPIQFLYVDTDWKVKFTDASTWQQLREERGLSTADPMFVDPPSNDFRLKAGSPLSDRVNTLPAFCVDPALIEEARRFKAWATEGLAEEERIRYY